MRGVFPAGSLVTPGGTAPAGVPPPRRAGRHERGPLAQADGKEGIAVVHICECGLATTDLGFLKGHLARSGHRERVPWWSLLAHVALVK